VDLTTHRCLGQKLQQYSCICLNGVARDNCAFIFDWLFSRRMYAVVFLDVLSCEDGHVQYLETVLPLYRALK
jgi:hypothetical protein